MWHPLHSKRFLLPERFETVTISEHFSYSVIGALFSLRTTNKAYCNRVYIQIPIHMSKLLINKPTAAHWNMRVRQPLSEYLIPLESEKYLVDFSTFLSRACGWHLLELPCKLSLKYPQYIALRRLKKQFPLIMTVTHVVL